MANLTRADDTDAELLDAIEALKNAEKLLAGIARNDILTKLSEITAAIESIPQVQLDLRISRMRLSARLSHDPDKTPVQNVKGASSQYLARAESKPRDDEP